MQLINILVSVLVLLLYSVPVWAIHPSNNVLTKLEQKKFAKPELQVSSSSEPLEKVRHLISNDHANAQNRFSKKHGQDFHFHIDPRSGTTTNIVGHIPFIPGRGKDNHIKLEQVSQSLGHQVNSVDAATVSQLMKKFIQENQDVLNLDGSQAGAVQSEKVTGQLWQLHATQEVNGIKVRGSRLAATISNGNLVMIGTERWGNVQVNTTPKITAAEALTLGFQYVEGQLPADEILTQPTLELVPLAPLSLQDGDRYTGPMGKGYEHRLVWTFTFKRTPEPATWEVMVDAKSGEILSYLDLNQYLTSSVSGGIYPMTSTEICPAYTCCGTMQPDQPMPFADTGLSAPNDFTSSTGLFEVSSGNIVTSLSGKYVKIHDTCGAIHESAFGSNGLDLGGSNGQHDCVSGGSSAGNTAAARSAFYEINRIKEMARGYLPYNNWLNSTLTANVNLNETCNAYWDGGTVNFFKSGGGCRNSGEIAQVFDHEWAHGLDAHDGNGLSSPSEAYADIAAMYRLQASCMGHGFFETYDKGCGQTADGTGFNTNIARSGAPRCALNCSGVRETDWQLLSGPANTPDTPANFVCGRCGDSSAGYYGPCGREAHCESLVDTESAWDFVARDLQSPPFSYDANTAFLIANRIFFQAAGNIGNWHTCACASSTSNGCGATNAYMQWLAADDDDGDISNGTPHMTALYNAFNRHGIACETPAPVNSGCAGAPAAPPVLTLTPGTNQVGLSWTADPAATKYSVFRTEGVAGCDTGKTLIATVTGGTVHNDLNLANGRQYCYAVMAVGSSDACPSPSSTCQCVTPTLSSQGTLQGVVSSAATGTPLYNATVSATGGYLTSTDSSGRYRFDELPGGTYDLAVAALGYHSQTLAGVDIGNGATITRDVALESVPMTTVQGAVTDGSGHGWPLYASVRAVATGYADNQQSGYVQMVYTDPVTGQYTLPLYRDTPYVITVESTGYNAVTRDFTSAAGTATESFSLTVDQETCAPGYGMLYAESFENGNGRYTRLSKSFSEWNESGWSDWQWGKPESGPYSAHSGKYVWATNLTGPFFSEENTYLVSPDIDLSGNAGHQSVLSWWQWLNTDSPLTLGRAGVDISNNSGASWKPFVYAAPEIVNPWSRQSLLLSTSYSVSTFRVRFHFESLQLDNSFTNVAPGWYIDDVQVSPVNGCQFQPGGLVTGYVTDAASGAGVNGVVITTGTGQTTASVATANDPGLNDGFYTMFLPAGAHNLTASLYGYGTETVSDLTVANDTVKWQDIALNPLPPLTITTSSMPIAVTGTPYNQSLSASHGLAPYTWAMFFSALPEGLLLNASTGVISGTPAVTGTTAFTVQLTDKTGAKVSQNLSIAVYNPLVIDTGDSFFLPATAYSKALEASGGNPPYSWTITSGRLPTGMVLDSGSGILSSAAPAAEAATVTMLVTDANNSSFNKILTLTPSFYVTGYQPVNGAVVPVTAKVLATFSELLSPATVTPDNFMISSNGMTTAIAAGDYHSVALKSDGTVVVWGKNDYGQLNVPSGLTGVTAIAAGSGHTLALKSDGTVICWGNNDYGQTDVPVGLTGVIAIAAGEYHNLALKSDGTVVAWGRNGYGSASVPVSLSGVIAIAAGESHSVALKSGGTVVAWGYNGEGEATVPLGLGGVTAIAAGDWHTVALKSDGTVVSWGYNNNGQTTVPAGLTGVISIAAGDWCSLALKSDGTVVGWGLNNNGQATAPAGLSGVSAVAAGADHSVVLKSDGTVTAWGDDSYGQVTIPVELTPASNAVKGTLTYDDASLTVTYTPSALLSGNTRYNVAITGIASQNGVPLAAPLSWSFTTHDLAITTATLPFGTINAGYSTALAVSGGTSPYTWSITSGTLPDGLSFNASDATISGTPTTIVTRNITFKVVDVNGISDSREFSIAINSNVLTLSSTVLPDGYRTTPYSATLTATGGTPPYSWSRTSGTLPTGLTLAGSTGIISGTPTATGARTMTFRVGDAVGATSSTSLTISIYSLPVINTSSPAVGTTGSAYSQTLTVTGGKASFIWSITSGTLPPGLSLGRTTGQLAGTPTTAGDYTFTVQVADANGTTASTEWTLRVYQPLVITTVTLPYAIKSSAYSQSLSAAGGLAPYTWSISGALPPGIFLDSASGEISGSSTSTGIYPVTVTVTDAKATYASRTFALNLTTYLSVIGQLPPNGAMAQVNTSLSATFSDALDPATVTPDNFNLIRGGAVKNISAGGSQTVALRSDGTVASWGDNDDYGRASVPGGMTNVIAISAAAYHTVALRNDGTLVAWGDSTWDRTNVPLGLTGVTAIAAGEQGNLVLKNDGTVVGWGEYNPKVPDGLADVIAISLGSNHGVALKKDGKVVVWGESLYGQTTIPTGLAGVKAISAGGYHTVALKNDGTVVAWGDDTYGQASVPTGLSGVIAVAAGYMHTVVLKNDGTLVAWGGNDYGQSTVPDGLAGIIAIAAGGHTVALKDDGTLVTWGNNENGQNPIPAEFTPAGNAVDGSLAYGAPSRTITLSPSAPLSGNVTYFATVAGVASQAGVPLVAPVKWSFNTYYGLQITNVSLPAGTTGRAYIQTMVAAGGVSPYTWSITSGSLPAGLSLDSTTGLLSGNPTLEGVNTFMVRTVDAKGAMAEKPFSINIYAPLSISTQPLANAVSGVVYNRTLTASGGLGPYAWSIDIGALPPGLSLNTSTGVISGTPVNTGIFDFTVKAVDVNQSSATQSLSISVYTPLVVNDYQPANGAVVPVTATVQATFSEMLDPVSVTAENFTIFHNVTQVSIAAGGYHSLALRGDGTVVAWGDDENGQATVPEGLAGVTAIAAGDYHSVALKSDGTVVAWGYNDDGETTIPEGLSDVIAIAAGGYHTLALKSDGTVVTWGYNSDGQITIPEGLGGVIAIAAGGYHSVALKDDGTVVAWGYNDDGEATIPDGLSDVIAIAAGGYHALALKNDGTVVAWGWNYNGQTTVPASLAGVIAIAAGETHSLALRGDKTVVAWGNNYNGQINTSEGLTAVTIAAGGNNSMVLKEDDSVIIWGDNSYSQAAVPAGLRLSGTAVSGSLNYYPAEKTVTFTPAAPLSADVTYRVRVAEVTSQTGVPLASPVQWSFSTTAMEIATTALADGTKGTAYSQAISVVGGVTPHTWSITAGSLPAGLSLDSATGQLAGNPTAAGVYSFTVMATDAQAARATKPLTLTIHSPISINALTLPFAITGTAYSQTLAASGGVAPYTWSIISGALPTGMTLDGSTGVISGTPTVAGDYPFSITASCSASSDTKQFSVTVKASAIRVPGVTARYFSLLQGAYDVLADGEIMEMQGVDFTENLDFNRDVTVVLKGGYSNDYAGIDSITTVRGSVTIRRGTVVIDNLILGP